MCFCNRGDKNEEPTPAARPAGEDKKASSSQGSVATTPGGVRGSGRSKTGQSSQPASNPHSQGAHPGTHTPNPPNPPSEISTNQDHGSSSQHAESSRTTPNPRKVWEDAYCAVSSDPELKPFVEEYEESYRKDFGAGDGKPKPEKFEETAKTWKRQTQREAKQAIAVAGAVKFIQKTQDIVSSTVAPVPGASLAWTGICIIVLPMVLKHAQTVVDRDEGFAYVLSRLDWYSEVLDFLNKDHWKSPEDFFQNSNAVYNQLVNLYKLLIEYQLRVYYATKKTVGDPLRNVFKPDDWAGMRERIREAEDSLNGYIDLYYRADHLSKLHELVKTAQKLYDAQLEKREESLSTLRLETHRKFKFPSDLPYSVYQRYLDSIDRRQDGTGNGVLKHTAFVKWVEGDSGAFVLEGVPGSGKSVLSKFLLTELPKLRGTKKTTTCAFFFRNNVEGQTSPATALCRVLDELFKNQHHLLDRIMHSIRNLREDEVRCNFDLLWRLLEDATSDCEPGDITVIFDAFDECDHNYAKSLRTKIENYLKGPNPRIKFFITTRPSGYVSGIIQAPGAVRLIMEKDEHCQKSIHEDIESVLVARFDDFARDHIGDGELRDELLEIVKGHEHQHRTYLFVKLLFDYLELKFLEAPPVGREGWISLFKVKGLPSAVKEAYLGFLSRIGEGQREVVRRLFRILVAAKRPLTLQEANIALTIHDVRVENQDGLRLQTESEFRTWITDACKYFLVVHENQVDIHKTARDFLLAEPSAEGPNKPDWLRDFTLQSCHLCLAQSCFLYIALPLRGASRFSGRPVPSGSPEPSHLWEEADLAFSAYARSFLRHHCLEASITIDPGQQGLPPLLQPWYQRTVTWIATTPSLSESDKATIGLAVDGFAAGRTPKREKKLPAEPQLVNNGGLGGEEDIAMRQNIEEVVKMVERNKQTLSDARVIPENEARNLDGIDSLATDHTLWKLGDVGPVNLDISAGQLLRVDLRAGDFVLLDRDGRQLPHVSPIRNEALDAVPQLAALIRKMALFQSVKSLAEWKHHSPIPAEWFSVHVCGGAADDSCELSRDSHACDGKEVRAILSNHSNKRIRVYVLSISDSYDVRPLNWDLLLEPGQQKHLDRVIHGRPALDATNETSVVKETVLFIGCFDELRLTAKEFFQSVYVPPVFLGPEEKTECPHDSWPCFIPPPTWSVKGVTVSIKSTPSRENDIATGGAPNRRNRINKTSKGRSTDIPPDSTACKEKHASRVPREKGQPRAQASHKQQVTGKPGEIQPLHTNSR